MDLILTRTKQEHLSILWEPFATSTPLKFITKDGRIENVLSNAISLDFSGKPAKRGRNSNGVRAKKVRKSKSSACYDPTSSSSSDEDCSDVVKRPVIKLSAGTRTRSLLSNRHGESEAGRQKESGKTAAEGEKNATERKKTERGNGNLSGSSDEGSKIFDETRNDKSRVVGLPKENATDVSKNGKQCGVNETEKRKVSKMQKVKPTGQIRKGSTGTKNNKMSKVIKRKTTKGTSDKSAIQPTNLQSATNQMKVSEKKANSSHQLFSESREQETINTLDLTSVEVSEAVVSTKCPMWENQKKSNSKQTTTSSQGKDSANAECEPERPKRIKQKPKEFWLPDTTSEIEHAGKNGKSQKVTQKRRELPSVGKSEETKENDPELVGIGVGKSRKVGMKRGNVQKRKNQNGGGGEVILKDTQVNCEFDSSHVGVHGCKGLDVKKPTENTEVGEEPDSGKTVFKPLRELTFKENGTGCSVVQCHNINNFKCGVFKVKTGSQLKCKTLHRNSHLGGVLVKGSIKMRIGEEGLDLREGDMAFVPPLTEWEATNICDSEAVFYYWCGRFK